MGVSRLRFYYDRVEFMEEPSFKFHFTRAVALSRDGQEIEVDLDEAMAQLNAGLISNGEFVAEPGWKLVR